MNTSQRRRISTVVFVVALLVAAVAFRKPLIGWFGGTGHGEGPRATEPGPSASSGTVSTGAPAADEIDHYTCPMHTFIHQHDPGNCPICGMTLVPVTKAQLAQGVVRIDEARRQLIGVRTGTVTQGSAKRTFRAVGQVTYDESKLSDVNLKVQGWITKLFVTQTGQRVTRGQPLFQLYSPELYNAQQDFLLATQGAAPSASTGSTGGRVDVIARAARQRLHLLGLSDAQVDAISKKGAPLESLTISSPASGFVIEKNVVEGASVDPGMRLMRIAALNEVWVEADVYEGDLAHVRVGQEARVTLDYLPERAYEAKVQYIYPYLDPKARTGRVRVVLSNTGLELRPGMYASVELTSDTEPRLQVPATAVVYTGPRRLVFVDLGDGRFRPQEIQVGAESDGMYEVLGGLSAGDVVATSGVFLIAAEARISTATKYWDDTAAASAAPSAPVPPPNPAPPPAKPGPPQRYPSPTSLTAHPIPSLPHSPSTQVATPAPAPAPTVYTCPMHPEVRSPTPGKCPICGMDLVPAPGGGTK